MTILDLLEEIIGECDDLEVKVAPPPKKQNKPRMIADVIYNGPATIIKWTNGDKTIVKCSEGDSYDKRVGFLLCVIKRMFDGEPALYSEIMNWLFSDGEKKTKKKKVKQEIPTPDYKKIEREDIKKLAGLLF